MPCVDEPTPQPLPNSRAAIIPQAKLVEYCLNPHHPGGGAAKATGFRQILGIERTDAEFLEAAIRAGIATAEATEKGLTLLGEQKYQVTFHCTGRNRRVAPVVTAWRMAADGSPHLITVYVKPSG
jgi:hypothetical protein